MTDTPALEAPHSERRYYSTATSNYYSADDTAKTDVLETFRFQTRVFATCDRYDDAVLLVALLTDNEVPA